MVGMLARRQEWRFHLLQYETTVLSHDNKDYITLGGMALVLARDVIRIRLILKQSFYVKCVTGVALTFLSF